MTPSWLKFFIGMAHHVADKSKDPSTKVGCVIVDNDNNILATGFNGFPRSVEDTDERYGDRTIKLALVVHAEANAIAAAARNGHRLTGSTAVVTKYPCSHCAGLLAQAGVKEVYAPLFDQKSSWADSHHYAQLIFLEAGVKVTIYGAAE